MKCVFAYNPKSGHTATASEIVFIIEKLKERFDEVEEIKTRFPKHMIKIANDCCKSAVDVLAFIGGDGTFNEVVCGIAKENNRPKLLYLPGGTMNDIGRNHKISRNFKKSIVKLLDDFRVKKVDVFKVNDSFAAYSITAGIMSAASYSAKSSYKKMFGKAAYYFEGVINNLEVTEFSLNISSNGENNVYNTSFITVSNSKSLGGYMVHKNADLSDGVAECFIIKEYESKSEVLKKVLFVFRKLLAFFTFLTLFAVGIKQIEKARNVSTLKSSEFVILAPSDIVWSYDGERGDSGNITVNVLKEHIELFY